MVKLKVIIYAFIFLILNFIYVQFFNNLEEIKLPNYTHSLTIVSWDQKLSKKEIEEEIDKISIRHNEVFIRVSDKYKGEHLIKTVTYFPSNVKHDKITPFSPNIDYEYLKVGSTESLKLPITSTFYTTRPFSKSIENDFEKLGLKVVYSYQTPGLIFNDFIQIYSIIPLLIVILILVLMLNIVDTSKNLYQFAIQRLNGWSMKRVFWVSFNKEMKIILITYSISAMIMFIILIFYNQLAQFKTFLYQYLIYSVSIIVIIIGLFIISFGIIARASSQISKFIKGAMLSRVLNFLPQTMKMVLIVIVLTTMSVSLNNLKTYQSSTEAQNKWKKIEDLYVIDFVPLHNSRQKYHDKITIESYKLLQHQKSNNVIISRSDAKYGEMSISDSYDRYMWVNRTFLQDQLNFNEINRRVKQFSNNTLLALYPRRDFNKDDVSQLKSDINNSLDMYYELDKRLDYTKVNKPLVKIVPYQEQIRAFNYNSRIGLEFSFETNPVLIVIPDQLPLHDLYYSALTKNEILFKDFEELASYIENSVLKHFLNGITDIKYVVDKDIKVLESNLYYNFIALSVSMIIYGFTLYFTTQTHFELHKDKIFIKYLYGSHFLHRHRTFLIYDLLLTVIVSYLIYHFNLASFSPYLYGAILLANTLIMTLLLRILERPAFNRYQELLKE
ncbi:DUF1430 domain-containing protein [Staphylococcus massiliensis]|uniref:DUF1430 domain-containing protein n=1 Tax=Staphylococcus massiliensis TaxID=555791 RepID=UPI001EDD4543|nr:DUF1430 domain-containing protein [Staphylococcus massiliensis]MCG3399055.1 DUF1430 domain-containing protein [Staphylococcus massiliensis]